MTVFAFALIGYAAGSLPSTWLVARFTGRLDVLDRVRREVGEADAHLLLKEVGGRAAVIASLLDVLKAFVPVLVATRVTGPYAIAACVVGTVAGHCWPPMLQRYAGRGVAAAAGAFLAFVPVEMVLAGIVRLLGFVVKTGGLASTVGFVAIPLVALYRGQPLPYVVAAAAINILIFARRLEGIGEDVSAGVPLSRAVVRRIVFDASAATDRSLDPRS